MLDEVKQLKDSILAEGWSKRAEIMNDVSAALHYQAGEAENKAKEALYRFLRGMDKEAIGGQIRGEFVPIRETMRAQIARKLGKELRKSLAQAGGIQSRLSERTSGANAA